MRTILLLIWLYLLIELSYGLKWGVLLRKESAWIGCHYSEYNKRYCLNIVPCVTIWWIKQGGKTPSKIL